MSEVCVDRMRLEHISGFIYLGYVLDESSTDEAEYHGKVASGRRVAGAIIFLVCSDSFHYQSSDSRHRFHTPSSVFYLICLVSFPEC